MNRGSSSGNNVNASSVNYVAYCWHDVPNLQKFGSFEGNEDDDGPFVELGFRPTLILLRNIDNSGTNYDWCIYDNTRSKSNPNDKFLCPNLNENENDRGDGNSDNARYVDFLSNGFKIRNNSSALNLNSHTIIYVILGRSTISLNLVWWSTYRKIRQFTNRLQRPAETLWGLIVCRDIQGQ